MAHINERFGTIRGSIPALITPFRNGRLDETAMATLVERQISEGSHGLVPCGTTGEGATLSLDEHVRVVEVCIEAAAGRAPVIAGAGSYVAGEETALLRAIEGLRAEPSPRPPYPAERGLRGLPTVVQNVETAVGLESELVLAEVKDTDFADQGDAVADAQSGAGIDAPAMV